MKDLSRIFAMPKWAKVCLVALSGVAIVLLVAVYGLQKWADNKIESAQITFSKIDKAKSANLENGYVYEAKVHFKRLEFLLRSSTISRIDLEKVAWESGIDLNAIRSVESQKRRLFFTTTQNLALDSGANLGIMSYKMDFSPLPTAIILYYLWIVFDVLFASLMLSFGKAQSGALLGGGGKRTFASNPTLSQSQISQIALFASLYLLFFTLNFIFPTQSDDLGAGFGGLSTAYKAYIGYNGRLGEFLRVCFGSYLAHTPLYPFINALFGVGLIYLFFILIFARLPLVNLQDDTLSQKLSDISTICFILICLFAFKGFGSVFYWAAGSFSYLWAWVLILIWCVPFRLFWGEILANDSGNLGESKTDSSKSNTKSHIFSMLFLGLISGWGSEFGIVLIVFQVALIAFALKKRAKLPLWYYAGVAGFIAGWLILYFSPGHATRASWNVFTETKAYISLGELLKMPLIDSFKRFVGTFRGIMPHLLIATLSVCVFLWFKFGVQKRKNKALIIAIALIFITLYSVPNLRFAFVFLSALLCFVGGFLLKKESASQMQMTYLFVLSGLFVAYFLMSAATIQIALPSRAQLPYVLLAVMLIIVVWLLLKPYFIKFVKIINMSLCAICAIYALFVVSEGITMRLKWERMLASIEAQKALGSEIAIVSADTFRSNYRGYGDWGNPSQNTNEWPNTTYAKVFGVKEFIVRENKNAKFN